MNPAFGPINQFDPMDARRSAPTGGTGLSAQLLAGGGGAQGGGIPESQQQHLAQPGGSPPVGQFASQQSLAQSPGQRPAPTGGAQSYAYEPSNIAAMNAWDPAMHPGRRRPTPGAYQPGHLGAIGTDYSRYAMGGNIGSSAPGSRSQTGAMPVDHVGDYPWMQDQGIQWGGGPFGYLPIGYQPQAFEYYSQNANNLAPWEYKYWKDTWTQNFDNNAPGLINTNRGSRDPDYYANLRG